MHSQHEASSAPILTPISAIRSEEAKVAQQFLLRLRFHSHPELAILRYPPPHVSKPSASILRWETRRRKQRP